MARLNSTTITGNLTSSGIAKSNGIAYSNTILTSGITLNSGSTYLQFVNHSAPIIINLPSSPYNDQSFKIKDVSGNVRNNIITIKGNGKNIDGLSATTIYNNYGYIDVVYNNSLNSWYISSSDVKKEIIQLAVSDETTDLTTGTSKISFRLGFSMYLTEVRSSVTTAPSGSSIVVDINFSGSTILSNKLTIDSTHKTSKTSSSPAIIINNKLIDDGEITVDIDQVGSSTKGKGLKITLLGFRI